MTFHSRIEQESKTMTASVLIVDDLESNRALLDRRLQKYGYKVLLADSGAEALAMLDRGLPDIILLDYMMPHMNGLDVLAKIRANKETRDLPVIMVTARAEADAVVEALDSGADDYVTKPIDFDVLRARMETHIEKRKSAASLARANAVLDQRVTLRSMALADLEGELQGEIRKRQELEVMLTDQPNHSEFQPHGDTELSILFDGIEKRLADLFVAVTSGKPANAAQILDLQSQVKKARNSIKA
jgi:DNA-binding response OmpR family regulator